MADTKRVFRIEMRETHLHVFAIEAADQQEAHDKANAMWPEMAEKVRQQGHLIERSLLVEERRTSMSDADHVAAQLEPDLDSRVSRADRPN